MEGCVSKVGETAKYGKNEICHVMTSLKSRKLWVQESEHNIDGHSMKLILLSLFPVRVSTLGGTQVSNTSKSRPKIEGFE